MAITDVSIANSALIKIGQERINSLDDTTKVARLCKERLPYCVLEVLRDHPWNFAMARASLSRLSDEPLFDWSYAYQKPTDCVRIWKAETDDIEFVVEGDQILTDEDTFYCRYITSNVTPGKYPPDFAETVAFRLAADLAYAIAQSSALQESMLKMYSMRLKLAKSNDAQEGTPDELIETTWDKVRY